MSRKKNPRFFGKRLKFHAKGSWDPPLNKRTKHSRHRYDYACYENYMVEVRRVDWSNDEMWMALLKNDSLPLHVFSETGRTPDEVLRKLEEATLRVFRRAGKTLGYDVE